MFCKINNLDLNNCIFGNVACLHTTTPCFARNLWGICAPAHAWQYHCVRNFHALKEILGTQGESWHHNFNFYGLSHDEENWAVVLSRKQKAQQAVQLQDLWPGHVGFLLHPFLFVPLKHFLKTPKHCWVRGKFLSPSLVRPTPGLTMNIVTKVKNTPQSLMEGLKGADCRG